jgi:hypothetical protein
MSYWENKLSEAKAKVRDKHRVLTNAQKRYLQTLVETAGWAYADAYMTHQYRQAVEELLHVYRDYQRTR